MNFTDLYAALLGCIKKAGGLSLHDKSGHCIPGKVFGPGALLLSQKLYRMYSVSKMTNFSFSNHTGCHVNPLNDLTIEPISKRFGSANLKKDRHCLSF